MYLRQNLKEYNFLIAREKIYIYGHIRLYIKIEKNSWIKKIISKNFIVLI